MDEHIRATATHLHTQGKSHTTHHSGNYEVRRIIVLATTDSHASTHTNVRLFIFSCRWSVEKDAEKGGIFHSFVSSITFVHEVVAAAAAAAAAAAVAATQYKYMCRQTCFFVLLHRFTAVVSPFCCFLLLLLIIFAHMSTISKLHLSISDSDIIWLIHSSSLN